MLPSQITDAPVENEQFPSAALSAARQGCQLLLSA